MARQWQQVSLKEAQQHPLYGVKNWLAVFAFGVLLLPLREFGWLNGAAHDAGVTLTQLLAYNEPFGTFAKTVLVLETLMAAVIFWLLFTKQRSFRIVTSSLLLVQWPVISLFALATKTPGAGEVIGLGLISWALSCLVWVTYLQRSRRVRITFENCLVVEEVQSQAPQNQQRAVEKHAGESGQPQATSQKNLVVPPLAVASSLPAIMDEEFWSQALAEFDGASRRQGLWARVFAEADGNEPTAKAIYLRERVRQLAEETQQRASLQVEKDAALAMADAKSRVDMKARIGNLRSEYVSGKRLAPEDLRLLAQAAESEPSLASIADRIRGETLLHWCARYDLQPEASILIKNGANANSPNGDGRRPYEIADGTELRHILRTAANVT